MTQVQAISPKPLNFQPITSVEFLDRVGVGRETHCRYVWSHQIKKHQWRAIGNRASGKKTHSLKDLYLDAEAFIPEKGERRCSVDCYYSPNQFWDWRNTQQLATLNANWLEIDTKEHKCLSLSNESIVIKEVFKQLSSSNMPLPNGYVLSGSGGMHLYWLYDEIPAYHWRVRAWREVSSSLIQALKGGELWEVDVAASRDPSRVLRLPGSIHSKSGRTVRAFLNNNARYNFDELASICDVVQQKPKLELVEKSPIVQQKNTNKKSHNTRVQLPEETGKGRHTIRLWWSKIFNHVHHFSRVNGVKNGKRDSTAFILYVALKHMVSEESAWERIVKLNTELIHLDIKELEAYLSTAKQVNYKYSKATLALYLSEQLGIDSSFLYEDKPTLSKVEVKERQQQGAAITAHKKSRQTLELLITKASTLVRSQTLTQANLVASSEKSLSTVKRYWAQVKGHISGVISSASIYPPHDKENETRLCNVI